MLFLSETEFDWLQMIKKFLDGRFSDYQEFIDYVETNLHIPELGIYVVLVLIVAAPFAWGLFKKITKKKTENDNEQQAEQLPDNIPTSAPTVPNSKRFIARDTEMKELKERLKKEEQLLIYGIGGMGKSTLASKLFHELCRENKYDYFCWVRCSQDLETSLVSAFRIFNDTKNPKERTQKVLAFLRDSKKKLLILDNVEKSMETDLLHELNSLPNVQVVLTSRASELSTFVPVKVEKLSEEDCVKLFYAYCPVLKNGEELEEVKKLIVLVGGHTLALELLARAVPRDRSLAAFYDELYNKGFDLRNLEKVSSDYDKQSTTVANHLKILYDIKKRSRKHKAILRTLAFMPTVELPAKVAEWIGCKPSDLNALVDSGWLESHGRNYYMHPVVKQTILLDKKTFPKDTGKTFVENLASGNILDENEPYSTILPKLELADGFLTEWRKWNPEKTEPVARACHKLGYHYLCRAMYRKAMVWNQSAVEILENILPGSPALAASYGNLGSTYGELGDHAKALEYLKKALEIRQKALPANHPDLATSYNNVGGTYGELGDHAKALEYQEKALEIWKKALPADHPDLATSYNNVGATYGDLGDHAKALEYKEKALEIWKKALPADHPNLATSYNNVGVTYGELGDHAKALEYKEKALEIRKKALPADHPHLVASYNNVGSTYGELGDHAKALEYQEKALEIDKKVLPDNHPDLATDYNDVGVTYGELGDHAKALEYKEKALEIRKKALPADHPDLAQSYHNVGATLYQLERYPEAQELLRKAVEICKNRPECRRYLAVTYGWLFVVERALGNAAAAEDYEAKRKALLDRLAAEDN